MDSLSGGTGRSAVFRTSDEYLRAIAGSESNLAILRELRAARWIVATMVARDSVLGALAVAEDHSTTIADADAEVVADLADRTAMAVAARCCSRTRSAHERRPWPRPGAPPASRR